MAVPARTWDSVDAWLEALRERHLQGLRFSDVRRAAQALSDVYVHKRDDVARRALDGAGKRAAFALYFSPLHFLLVRHILAALSGSGEGVREILDLGCGTGAAGLAWALHCGGAPALRGVDRNPWAIGEATWSAEGFGLRATFRPGDALRQTLPGPGGAICLAFTVNELPNAARAKLLNQLVSSAARGARVLVVEPIAKAVTPWWEEWAERFIACGGRHDLWRVPTPLPEILRLFDKATGLRHDILKGRSLYLAPTPGAG